MRFLDLGDLFFDLFFCHHFKFVVKLKLFVVAKFGYGWKCDRRIDFHDRVALDHVDSWWRVSRFDIRFFDCDTDGFGNESFHRFVEEIIPTNELLYDPARGFALTETWDANARRNLLVRPLEMLLHTVIFYFNVKNSLTIFCIVASYFQRVLRNIHL